VNLRNLPVSDRNGFTVVQMLVATALGTLITTAVILVWIFSARSFVALGNYTDLDSKSRYAVDCMLRDIRNANQIVAFQSNGTTNFLQVTNSQTANSGATYTWDSASRNLVCQKTGEGGRTYLTECDLWDVQLYQRTPHPSGTYVFYPATNVAGAYDTSICKLINMTWKCSRTILGNKINTENVQTAQVVLRNKQ
jgi:type II secretory pathway component PulJ